MATTAPPGGISPENQAYLDEQRAINEELKAYQRAEAQIQKDQKMFEVAYAGVLKAIGGLQG